MKKGFTVIEMMFCLVIVIVLMGLVIPNVLDKQELVKDKGCQALVEIINSEIILFQIKYNELPNSIDDLINADPPLIKETQKYCSNGIEIYIQDGQAYAE